MGPVCITKSRMGGITQKLTHAARGLTNCRAAMRRERLKFEMAKFLAGVMFWVIVICISGYCTEYTVEFWAAYFGKPTDVPFLAACLGALLGPVVMTAAIITFLLSFVV